MLGQDAARKYGEGLLREEKGDAVRSVVSRPLATLWVLRL